MMRRQYLILEKLNSIRWARIGHHAKSMCILVSLKSHTQTISWIEAALVYFPSQRMVIQSMLYRFTCQPFKVYSIDWKPHGTQKTPWTRVLQHCCTLVSPLLFWSRTKSVVSLVLFLQLWQSTCCRCTFLYHNINQVCSYMSDMYQIWDIW